MNNTKGQANSMLSSYSRVKWKNPESLKPYRKIKQNGEISNGVILLFTSDLHVNYKFIPTLFKLKTEFTLARYEHLTVPILLYIRTCIYSTWIWPIPSLIDLCDLPLFWHLYRCQKYLIIIKLDIICLYLISGQNFTEPAHAFKYK